jgi:cellulose synthase/poly-beta-1,6-N-acetylglucosamine synthase-like glycosyltransferase
MRHREIVYLVGDAGRLNSLTPWRPACTLEHGIAMATAELSAKMRSAGQVMDNREKRRRLITISVPVYNEADNVTALIKRLRDFSATQPDCDFEFLFTDNASEDATYERLAEEAKTDPRVRVIRFSRNFGYQRSILTNFLLARGDAAVQVDADLQDPPEMIAQ